MTQAFIFNDFDNTPDLKPEELERIQCYILRSAGRARSTQVFHRFKADTDLAAWLAESPAPSPSTAKGNVLRAVLFSAKALKRLGFDPKKLGMDEAFCRGSRAQVTQQILNDTQPGTWREHEDAWDVVELHAHGPAAIEVKEQADYVVEFGSAIDVNGKPTSNNGEPSYGHFGIRDGISMPVYTSADYEHLSTKPDSNPVAWDVRQKLSTVLVRDVLSESESGKPFGSYFVFRKYKQDRDEFNSRVKAIAELIEARRKVQGDDHQLSPEKLGIAAFQAKGHSNLKGEAPPDLEGKALYEPIKQWIFGRDTEGHTALSPTLNNFNYDADRSGAQCPFHAHIRKMNERGLTGDEALERKKTVARRGISGIGTLIGATGKRRDESDLLFWCAQASIKDQFEYIQQKWANHTDVDVNLLPTPDLDAVIGGLGGQLAQAFTGNISRWKQWKTTADIDYSIWTSITAVGTEYLYAPSLDGFERLKAAARDMLNKGKHP
jgi:deferrochelatase/peroxidase EfeB